MIADWLSSWSLDAWKPLLSALSLPPVPLLVLVLAGAWRARRHPRTGFALVALACAALWMDSCEVTARFIQARLLRPPPALTLADREAWKARAQAGERLAIVVLGGGIDPAAAEYGASTLAPPSMERLRYGLWLGRATGIPVAMSGGRGWAARGQHDESEAEIAGRIAETTFGLALKWRESSSHDTHENAVNTLALLSADGVHHVLLVTHGWHMPRALREFRAAASRQDPPTIVDAAPMGLGLSAAQPVLDWVPSGDGALHVHAMLHELLGAIAMRREPVGHTAMSARGTHRTASDAQA